MTELRNWAGNLRYSAERVHLPATVGEVQEVVVAATRARALGSRHSFNSIADSESDLISLEKLDRVLGIDPKGHTVQIEAGVTYGGLSRHLAQRGWAIHNLASLPHISVAGACATATHGSGDRNRNLASAVTALELVTADGSMLSLSREQDPHRFPGAVVALGALGVVASLTLEIQPTFEVCQEVFEHLTLESLAGHFDEVTSSAYSVSLFTDWRRPAFNQVWLKQRGSPSRRDDFFGARPAKGPLHPISSMSPEFCTQQMGVPGPWDERLAHFRLEFTPSAGDELQTEYLVPRRHALDALHTIDRLKERIAPLLQISEIRTVAADDLWMSPCYGEDCVGIHFTWLPDWAEVRGVLPTIEQELAPYDARPHWGKLFAMGSDRLAGLYPRLSEFRQLALRYDPKGKFWNRFLEEKLGG